MEEEGEEDVRVCDPYCIFCGSVVTPKKKTFCDKPIFYSVWAHLCTQMKVATTTRDSLYDRLMNGEGTFCKKNCLPILVGISKLLRQISNLQERLEEKTVEIRNRVVAASALDKQSNIDEESLVYSFRLLISRHFKVIKRHNRKSGPCPKSKKTSLSKTTGEAPPETPEEPAKKCGMTLRNKSLPPAVEVKSEEEWETDTDDEEAETEPPSTTEDMDCSPPEEETTPPLPEETVLPRPPLEETPEIHAEEKPKRKYKYTTPFVTTGSFKCPKCPFSLPYSSSSERKLTRQQIRSHYHTEHFYKKLVSREDLQKTPDGKDYFQCPSCTFKAFLKYERVQSQANREHSALTCLRNHFIMAHEGEQKLTGNVQKLHGALAGNSTLPEFNLAEAEENVDFFKCPFGGCGFVSQVIDPHAKYPKGQEHRRSAILRVARHYLRFHEDTGSFEKTRRSPVVVRDPETQEEIFKCPKCELKLEYIPPKVDSQKSMAHQLKFMKHYASHILPIYTNRPNLYQKDGGDE